MMKTPRCQCLAALVLAASVSGSALAASPLRVCMADDNPPMSYQVNGTPRGLDVRIAQAIAGEMKRPLQVVLFESEFETDKNAVHEVNALLSSGACDFASSFPLTTGDLGPPSRATARVPDYPGAGPRSLRPWVRLGTLVPSRAYQSIGMGLVVRSMKRASMTLATPGDARIGIVAGTMSGAVVTLLHQGRLRAQTVELSRHQDPLALLEEGRFDATLVNLARYDAWRLKNPSSALRQTGYVHPLRINVGIVSGTADREQLEVINRVIDHAIRSGDLQRWAAEEGSTWLRPVEPQVSGPVGLAQMLAE